MIFIEKKQKQGFEYAVEDVFGKITIASDIKLDGQTLDDLVLLLLKGNGQAETINGSVKIDEKNTITYSFKKASVWAEDNEPCKNIPTSTNARAKGFTQPLSLIRGSYRRALNWLRKFEVAFREAWKKSSH